MDEWPYSSTSRPATSIPSWAVLERSRIRRQMSLSWSPLSPSRGSLVGASLSATETPHSFIPIPTPHFFVYDFDPTQAQVVFAWGISMCWSLTVVPGG